jgi:hypothetical protein
MLFNKHLVAAVNKEPVSHNTTAELNAVAEVSRAR